MADGTKGKLSMKEMLKLLLTIQEYDSKLLELEMRKSFFPDLLKQLKDEVENLEEKLTQKKERFSEVKKEIDMLELNLATEKTGLDTSQKRLMKVSNNKEYDAVQTEIRTHENNIAEIEQQVIVLMDEQETLEKEVSEIEEKFGEKQKENKSRIKEIETNASQIDSIIEKVRAERENLTNKVSPRLIRKYDMIRSGKQGVAVVPIVDRACGGCRQALPPQRIQEIRAGKLVICENCGRIIVDIEKIDDEK